MKLIRKAIAAALSAAVMMTPGRVGAQQSTAPTTLSGHVMDRDGKPVADATVGITELGRTTTTTDDGTYRLGGVPAGRYTITARRLGYIAAAKVVVVTAQSQTVDFALTPGALRIEPVNVTATRSAVASAESPLPTSVLTDDAVSPVGGISLAHSVAALPGVRDVSSGQQIAKPMIRGLFGPRVLVLADGSRLEDYSWSDEDGPSIDARLAERIEVIRGPASVLYGSEALGGVVNVIPTDLPFSADGSTIRHQAIEAYAASNNIELGSAAMADGARGNIGWRLEGTGRFSQNYKTPDGEQQNSSFWAVNGNGALGFRDSRGNTTLRFGHYGGEFHLLEASGPEAGDPTGGPVRQTMDDRLQVTNEHSLGGIRLETKAQFQRHSLTEVSDDCVPEPGQTTCVKVKDRQAFQLVLNTGTLDVLAHHTLTDAVNGTIGVSGMAQSSSSAGPIFIVPSATIDNLGAFAFEQGTWGPLSITAGARADTRHLSTDSISGAQFRADSRNWSALSGDVGAMFHVTPELALLANYGAGWRAPTLFDLYTNGPNLAEARFEIGDSTLETERSHDLDGGVRWASTRVRAEATVFSNLINGFIYTTPTQQAINGLQVYRHVQADARLNGAELSAAADVAEPLTLRASYDFVNGTDRRTDTPLPLMPPPRTIVGAELHSSHLSWAETASFGVEVEHDATQTRLSPVDFPTSGYTLLNLDFSMEHTARGRPYRLDIDVRNALNTSYRDFLSRYKTFATGPGTNVIVRLSTGTW